MVMFLTGQGASMEQQDHNGNNALQIAIAAKQDEIAACLIECGAPLNNQNKQGKTALMMASEEMTALLLEKGADAKLEDQEGKTFVDYLSPSLRKIIQLQDQIHINK